MTIEKKSASSIQEKIKINESVIEVVPNLVISEKDKNNVAELKTEIEESDNEKIKKIKSEIESKLLKGNEKEEEIKGAEIKNDSIAVEMSDSKDEDSFIIHSISIDSEGKTYGDDKLNYEQLGLKLFEAEDSLERLKKEKSKLAPYNKFLEKIMKILPYKDVMDFEVNKQMSMKASQGIGRLEKRIEFLKKRIIEK